VVQPHERIGDPRRLRELDPQRALRAHRLGAGELGQALHPRLRLFRLAGLGLEAVDERLQVRAFGLFLLERDLLLAQLLGALALECGVVAGVELRPALVQVQGVGGDVVEEFAVVRDHQQRAGIAQQPLLQPQHGVEVEVVGRFVQQQEVRWRHQRARYVEAHAPAAGEIRDRLRVRFRREAEPVEQPAGTGRGVVAVEFLELLVRLGDRLPVLVGEGVRLHLDRVVHGLVAGQHEIERGIGQRRRFLRDRGDARLAGQVEVALVGLEFAHQRREQAGFAGAIAPDHAHAPAGVQGQVDVGQKEALAPAQGEVAEGDHAGIVPVGMARPPCVPATTQVE
jgi:hypothetical protein